MDDIIISYKHPENLSTNAIPGSNPAAEMCHCYGYKRVNE